EEMLLDAFPLKDLHYGARCREGQGFAGVGGGDDSLVQCFHPFACARVAGNRIPICHALGKCAEIRLNSKVFHRPSAGEAESRENFVKDESDAVSATLFAQSLKVGG